ncbi:MAG: chitobiase/beta-hexosaminidase C-terminal domain-containing protein [Candidatus Acidiferrum sp.]
MLGLTHGVRLIAALGVVLLALGVVALTTNTLKSPGDGSRATGMFNWWPAQTVQAQGTSGTPTYTTFTVPGAGTSALQGTLAVSINAEGDIAGLYLTAANVAHGYVRSAATGTITTFDAPDAGAGPSQGTFALSIDTAGDIAGIYFDANNAYHSFARAAATGTITEFDIPTISTTTGHRGTLAFSINDAGMIAGLYSNVSAVRHGYIRSVTNGTASYSIFNMTGAGSTSAEGTSPLSINTAGAVTGTYQDASGLYHGFVRRPLGAIVAPIDAPGASTVFLGGGGFSIAGTAPTSIDTAGDIAGFYTDANALFHGFFYTASSATPAFTTLDITGAGTSGMFPGTIPLVMNGAGDISGFYEDGNGVNHGFVRAANGTVTAPIDAPGAGTSGMLPGTISMGINAAGNSTGTYADANGVFHGFARAPAAAAAPSFSPAAGPYTSAQTVTISDATPGATIYYTTDGTTPTAASTVYSDAITVNATETIEAIAVADSFSNSVVASATYTINLNAPDFQVSVSPTTLTIVAGQSGQATFTVTPVNGFNSPVNFACSGLPAEAACGFNPTSVTPNGAPVTSTLTVTTTAASAALRAPRKSYLRPIYAFLFLGLTMLFGMAVPRKGKPGNLPLIAFLVLLIAASGLASCSGGNTSGGNNGNPGTPIGGPDTVSVSASTSAGAAVSHGATLTITITQ